MPVEILQGDVFACLDLLPSDHVHTIVTSPPYWGLRDYGVVGQIGMEPTPQAHVETLVTLCRELRRVLRPDGLLWMNYGDMWASSVIGGLKAKDLVGMPWRIALALQADGWWLRDCIIWHKPNPMPSSVKSRCTPAYEYIFMLAKSDRYYFDHEAIKEPIAESSKKRYAQASIDTQQGGFKQDQYESGIAGARIRSRRPNEIIKSLAADGSETRAKRNVWTVPTQPVREAHFATFPERLIEPCILAGAPERACTVCGAPHVRVVESTFIPQGDVSPEKCARGVNGQKPMAAENGWQGMPRGGTSTKTLGWKPTCAHVDAPTTGGIVLDPFFGSGTTGIVAQRLGRNTIGIELNPEYVGIAKARIGAAEQCDPFQ